MELNNQQINIINATLSFINGNFDKLTRRFLCREAKFITEYEINKYFGNFTNFVDACTEVYNTDEDAYEFESITNRDFDEEPVLNGDENQPIFGSDSLFSDTTNITTNDFSHLNDLTEEARKSLCEMIPFIGEGYVDKGNYWYNPNTGDYLFDFSSVPNIGKPIVIPKTQLHAIQQAYSNFDKNPKAINAIAITQKIPAFILKKIFTALGFTHDSLPVTSELIEETNNDEKIADDLLAIRQFNIYEKFTHATWKQVQEQANKWINYEKGFYNPIIDAINSFEFPKVDWNSYEFGSKDKFNEEDWDSDKYYIVSLSDIHFGAFADKNNLFLSDEDWNLEKTQEAIFSYAKQIYRDLANRKSRPKNLVILSVGDLLNSLSGFTDKGTPLINQYSGVTQFKTALNSLSIFFQTLLKIWDGSKGTIDVYSVSGNHDSMGDYCLMVALEKIFESKIKFHIGSTRWQIFQLGSNLFVMEHGYSAKYKSKVPVADKSKETYIQKLLIEKLGEFSNPIDHRYFVMGDRHHYSQKEMSSFEFIQLPSLMAHDEYSDALNLSSRPRQVTFILDKKIGITEVINHYFD